MSKPITENRYVWLTVGMIAGMAISAFWPHEPGLAATNDRESDNIVLFTAPVRDVTAVGVRDVMEGVFVLDLKTGQLKGAAISSQTGQFNRFYFANLVNDFKLEIGAQPRFTIVAGTANMPVIRGVQLANAVVYVAEADSGKIIAYAFPYSEGDRVAEPARMLPLDSFQFRQAF